MDTRTDNVLMQRVRDGDIARLAVLFERHHRALFSYFVRLTASRESGEDLVQDVFFRILKYRHTYQDGSQFTAWMYQIARRVHLDSLQRRRGEVIAIDDPERFTSDDPGPARLFERAQEVGLLQRALAALPPDKRELLVLARFQNLKYEQIGEILGCDVGAVKVRVYRAMKALGEQYHRLAGEKAS